MISPEELGRFLSRANPDQQVLCADQVWRPKGGGGGGTVTSVGLAAPSAEFTVSNSPVTTTGTLTLAWKTQTAATFFAGPTTGSPATPGFRAIEVTDLAGTPAAGKYWDGGTGTWTDLPAPGTGTVTSVGIIAPTEFNVSGSPVTTSGSITLAWKNETANLIFAGPASGSPGTPSFRAIVPADLAGTPAAGKYWDGTGTWTTLPAPGTGTVTSVGLSAPAEFTVSNSPVTTSGTLTFVWANQSANRVMAGPATGSPATPGFRALVAADIPALSYATSVGLSMPVEFTVSNSPVTSSGTLTVVWASESANRIFAGPTSGAAAVPSFRAMVVADMATGYPYSSLSGTPTIPTISGSSVLKGSSGNAVAAAGTDVVAVFTGTPTGAKFLKDDGTLAVPPGTGTGTVSSVALSLPVELTVSGSPVTTTGTLTAVWASQAANKVFAGPSSGAATTPSFRTLVVADLPVNINASINLFNYQNFT